MTDEQKRQIATEVRDIIEQAIESGQDADVAIVVAAVVGAWEAPRGRDSDKWTVCGYHAVRAIARDVVRRYEPSETGEIQESFPGFDGIHRAYVIPDGERKGKIVAAERMTVAEAMSLVAQLDRNISGLSLHKNNLLRFIDEVLIPAGNGN